MDGNPELFRRGEVFGLFRGGDDFAKERGLKSGRREFKCVPIGHWSHELFY